MGSGCWHRGREHLDLLGHRRCCRHSVPRKYSKDVGRATVTAFIGILCIYLLVSILSMGVMPRAELAELPNPSMAGVLEAVVGPWGAALVNLGVALSLLGAMLGYTIISSECPHEAAKQGVFPKVFAKKIVRAPLS